MLEPVMRLVNIMKNKPLQSLLEYMAQTCLPGVFCVFYRVNVRFFF